MRGEKNSSQAIAVAIGPHMPALWRFALSLSGRPDVADDLVQSTCLRAMEKADQFTPGSNLLAWSMTICRSIWMNQVRANTIRATQSLDATDPAALRALLPEAEANIFATEVFTQVMQLPEAQRQCVVLVYVEGFRYSEAAKILDVPIGTVMSRLAAARAKLAPLNTAGASGSKEAKT